MTPQLQQAIRLLQLSALELEQEIQDNLDANPLLEVEDEFNSSEGGESSRVSEAATDIADAQLGEPTDAHAAPPQRREGGGCHGAERVAVRPKKLRRTQV